MCQAVFVPQLPWTAPGHSLREQLIYPSTGSAPPQLLWKLLQAVQLEGLLDRVQGNWERQNDWQGEQRSQDVQRKTKFPSLHVSVRSGGGVKKRCFAECHLQTLPRLQVSFLWESSSALLSREFCFQERSL